MNRRDLFKRLLAFPVASAAGVALGKVFPKKRHVPAVRFQFTGAERYLTLEEMDRHYIKPALEAYVNNLDTHYFKALGEIL